MNDLTEVEPSALSVWLRIGRWSRPAEAPHFKFNPNHDPANGRFTFTGGGGSSGGGGASGSWSGPASQSTRKPGSKPSQRIGIAPAAHPPMQGAVQRVIKPEWRHVVANGYVYFLDEDGQARIIEGTLGSSPDQSRSRRAQSEAGGIDRLPSDDGGHYIARRFNGPTEAFNHFAQDSNFNRGRYHALENEWAKAKDADEVVNIRIVPTFVGRSKRPAVLNISWTINGIPRSLKIPNSREEPRDGN